MWFIYISSIYINKNKNPNLYKIYKITKSIPVYKIYRNVTKNLYKISKHHKTNLIKTAHHDGISLGTS